MSGPRPLVSVVILAFSQAQYLPVAIVCALAGEHCGPDNVTSYDGRRTHNWPTAQVAAITRFSAQDLARMVNVAPASGGRRLRPTGRSQATVDSSEVWRGAPARGASVSRSRNRG